MKLPFLTHSKSLDPKLLSSSSPWGFPSCGHIKTLSFRATHDHEDDDTAFRTFNSAFLDNSSSSRSFSTISVEDSRDTVVESVIQGLKSDRFFFEPEQSSSLVDENKKRERDEDEGERVRYKESEMLWMDSSNPYEDFKKSMGEMVEAHGLMKDWEGLEELLGCYLKINGKNNHGYILGAFIDLLVSFSFSSNLPSTSSTSTSTTTRRTTTTTTSLSSSNSNVYSSPSSPLSLPSSSLTTNSLSSILNHDDEDDDDHHTSS